MLKLLNNYALQQRKRLQQKAIETPRLPLGYIGVNQRDGSGISDVSKMKHHTPVILDFDLRQFFFQCQYRYV
jgi:hypothetical protein